MGHQPPSNPRSATRHNLAPANVAVRGAHLDYKQSGPDAEADLILYKYAKGPCCLKGIEFVRAYSDLAP